MTTKVDDLEAVRILAETLQPFASDDRERIIRWAREKLGMTAGVAPVPGPRAQISVDTPRDAAVAVSQGGIPRLPTSIRMRIIHTMRWISGGV